MVIVVAFGDPEECVGDITCIPRVRHATARQFILMTTTMVDATDKIPIPTTAKIVPSKKLRWFHWCWMTIDYRYFLCWLFVRFSCAKNEDMGFPGKILFGGTRTRYGRSTETLRVAPSTFYFCILKIYLPRTLRGSQKNGTDCRCHSLGPIHFDYRLHRLSQLTTAIPVICATFVQFIHHLLLNTSCYILTLFSLFSLERDRFSLSRLRKR
jgi:hypothetical protein